MQDILVKLEYLRQHNPRYATCLKVLRDMLMRSREDRSRNQLIEVLRVQQNKMGLGV